MTTATEIISLALRDIGVVGEGQTASGETMSDAFATLTQMLALWNANGLTVPTLVDPGEEVAVPLEYVPAIRYSLAEYLSSTMQTPLRPDVANLGRRARKIIKRNAFTLPSLEMPAALVSLGPYV